MDKDTQRLMDEIKSIQYGYRKTDELIPYARNPRKHDHVVEQMASQIKEFGFPVPICIRPDGSVVDGHLRLKAAKLLGLPEVPVAVNETWTPTKIKAYRISVNKTATLASWDEQFLALEMQELEEQDYDLLLTGFSGSEVNKLLGAVNFSADSTDGGGDGSGSFDGDENSHVKMIQLFFDEDTEKNFRSFISFIEAKLGTGNISDSVFAAVQFAAQQLEKIEAIEKCEPVAKENVKARNAK